MVFVPDHTSGSVLAAKLEEAEKYVEVGEVYSHYRNPLQQYKVLAIALLEANEKPCIVYQALHGSDSAKPLVWVRALDDWSSEVLFEGEKVSRFQKVLQKD